MESFTWAWGYRAIKGNVESNGRKVARWLQRHPFDVAKEFKMTVEGTGDDAILHVYYPVREIGPFPDYDDV